MHHIKNTQAIYDGKRRGKKDIHFRAHEIIFINRLKILEEQLGKA